MKTKISIVFVMVSLLAIAQDFGGFDSYHLKVPAGFKLSRVILIQGRITVEYLKLPAYTTNDVSWCVAEGHGNNSNDGRTWGTAWADISAATNASSGDYVLVRKKP